MIRVLFFFLFIGTTIAQEVVNPLIFNTSITHDNTIHKRSQISVLNLPFYEDFSNYLGAPNPNLWQDKDVYVNRSMPHQAINIGVATFDGLDSLGNPRDIYNANAHGLSDQLTSRAIDLSQESEVFFSFYYQPQGIGNDPQSIDVFKLQFKNKLDDWDDVWEVAGQGLAPFQNVIIPITDTVYLYENFEFRFVNYATLSGNFDHWNLDNILLTNDESLLNNNDVAFVVNSSQMLIDYTSVPWSHFRFNEEEYIDTILDSYLRNNYNEIQGVNYQFNVFNNFNQNIYHYPFVGEETRNDNIPIYDGDYFLYTEDTETPIDHEFDFDDDQSYIATFNIVQSLATNDSILFKNNDTLKHTQVFNNYYSYDDGTAEASYGLNVAGGMAAMRFDKIDSDILKAVQIHFEQNLDDASSTAFSISVWNNADSLPNNLIYQSQIFYPEYTNELNGFYQYELENPISVNGTVYIGWEQYYPNIINIGLDKNNEQNDRMFYNISGQWFNSSCADCLGSWMIRPVFGSVYVSDIKMDNSNHNLRIYPNPMENQCMIEAQHSCTLEVLDVHGKIIFSSTQASAHHILTKQAWASGLYFLKVKFEDSTIFEKLMVR